MQRCSRRSPARPRRLALAGAGALVAASCLAAAPPMAGAATTVRKSFSTAGRHTFAVPEGVRSLTVTAIGAAGGGCQVISTAGTGGNGASVKATVPVHPGSRLLVEVGGVGQDCSLVPSAGTLAGGSGGVGGGGTGGAGVASGASGAGGGGASGVGLKSLGAGGSPLVVAGGGGGASECGGTGGDAEALGGQGVDCGTSLGGGGVGATDTGPGAGGAAGTALGQFEAGTPGTAGSAGTGGNGGTSYISGAGGSGGGGGGGYYGGGGGGGGGGFSSGGGGGGGGASYTAPGATHVDRSGVSAAPASVTISYTTTHAPPKATTKRATAVRRASARLHGSVDPQGLGTTYYFQYGRSKRYGKRTASHRLAAGKSARSVTAALTGLKPGSTYHFRIVAVSASGTTYGSDRTFRTG